MPKTPPSWENRVSRYLRAELKRAGVTYEELAERLEKQGLNETKKSIEGKMQRGTFPATFLVTSLKAIGLTALELEDV